MNLRRLRVLWLNLPVSLVESDVPGVFADNCQIVHRSNTDDLDLVVSREGIDAICFDFDYPSRSALRTFRETKLSYPSVPIIMLSVQHSEALAVWTFRTGAWDYLVKPVPQYEAERCLGALSRIAGVRQAQRARTPALHANRIPDEIAFSAKPNGSALAPAIFFVEKNFRTKIRSENVAALCGLSPFRFSRAFRDEYGLNFRDYVVAYRLREACRLLENPMSTVSEVAYATGFNDPSYFTRIFKQRVGIPPSLMVGRALDQIERRESPSPFDDLPKINH